jgi:predicted transcriptional regulator
MVKNIGPLERKILEILWDKKEATAREISYGLEKKGNRKAYSTVRTIIRRLVEKNIIAEKRDKKEKIYKYIPIINKSELEKSIVHSVIGELLNRFEESTINYLTEELSENDEDIEKIKKKLDELKKDE